MQGSRSEPMLNDETHETQNPLEAKVTRRSFLDLLIGLFATITALPVIASALVYLTPPVSTKANEGPVEVGDEAELPVGTGRVYPFKDTKVLIVRTEDKLVALSAICTHAGCICEWQADKKQVFCPCHGGVFDLEGNVVAGPPPRPLAKYRISVQDGKITVAKA